MFFTSVASSFLACTMLGACFSGIVDFVVDDLGHLWPTLTLREALMLEPAPLV